MTNVREMRCPCRKCQNRKFQTLEEVKLHLFRKGFIANYYVWDRHEEQYVHATSTNFECNVHIVIYILNVISDDPILESELEDESEDEYVEAEDSD